MPRKGAKRMSSSISTHVRAFLCAFLDAQVQLGKIVGRKRSALLEGESVVERPGRLLDRRVKRTRRVLGHETGEPHQLLLATRRKNFRRAALGRQCLLELLRELVAKLVQCRLDLLTEV